MQSSMTRISALVLAMCASAGSAIAQQAHDAHHPDTTPSSTAVAKPPADSADQMAKLDRTMHDMRIMHDRMMQAKTPEERSALMADHAKAMHSGMSMLNGMMGRGGMAGSGARSPQVMAQDIAMLQKQMHMMHSMMQMMMDRMSMQGK